MSRKIVHLDIDSFYASVEQHDDPALRGRPLAVGGSRERGVVAAAGYEDLAVSRFHGVGPATAARMENPGIRTGRDLREWPLSFLQEHFGKAGAHFHSVTRGVDERPVVPDRPRKPSGSETTYDRDLAAPEEVEAGLLALVDEVWEWCERTGKPGRSVTVKIRYADFRQITRSRTLTSPAPAAPTCGRLPSP